MTRGGSSPEFNITFDGVWKIFNTYNDVTIIVMVIVTSIVLEVFQLSIFELEFPQDSDTAIVFFSCTNILTVLQNALTILKSDKSTLMGSLMQRQSMFLSFPVHSSLSIIFTFITISSWGN